MASATSGNGGDPSWAWLGLLKWSLAYTDGTRSSAESMKPMSAEDKEFLESVMKDGIINEGDRMKELLHQLTQTFESIKEKSQGSQEETKEISEDEMIDALEELRDIVEQIDFARAFAAMNGLPFLLGCASTTLVPISVRSMCLGIISTMAQNNPPVQLILLEKGGIRTLTELYFSENETSLRTKIVQTLSSSVRSHAMAEEVFMKNVLGLKMLAEGLSPDGPGITMTIRKRSLFFLRALATSDTSSKERINLLSQAIISLQYLTDQEKEQEAEIREMALELAIELVRQGKGQDIMTHMSDRLTSNGKARIASIEKLEAEEKSVAMEELRLWETMLSLLSSNSDVQAPGHSQNTGQVLQLTL